MMVDLPRIIIPFLTALLQVLTIALALGMLPALWLIGRHRQYGSLVRWSLFAIACIVAAAYALPLAHRVWRDYALLGFKPVAMWMGYFVSVFFAPMIVPEPLRIARKRLRPEQPDGNQRRGYRLPK